MLPAPLLDDERRIQGLSRIPIIRAEHVLRMQWVTHDLSPAQVDRTLDEMACRDYRIEMGDPDL